MCGCYCPCDNPAKMFEFWRRKWPNRITLNNVNAWNGPFPYDTPCLLVPLTSTPRTLLAHPERPANDTTQMPLRGRGGTLYLPWPGDWWIFNPNSATRPVLLAILAPCGPVVDFFTKEDYAQATTTFATVGVASAAALAANANRVYAAFVNDSANVIYLATAGNAAVVGSGIRLNANGGSYEMSKRIGNLNLGAIQGISLVAASNMTIEEGA